MVERGRARRLLVSLSVVLGAADSAWSAPETIAEQRLVLYAAVPADAPAGETSRRAWAIAQLEERAGNPDLAAAALIEALHRTGVEAATGALAGDPGKADARARFDETVKRAVAFAKRSDDGHLLLEALRWRPELVDQELEAIRAALLSGARLVPSNLRDALRVKVGTTPAWRAFLEDAWPPDRAEMDPGLESLGDLGLRLLHDRLSEALRTGDLKVVRRLADRIWRADRWDLEARVVRHLLDEVEAGVQLTAAEVASVPDRTPSESRIVIRLERARAARPEALGLSLAIAYRLQTVHLFADVQRETARVLASPRATADQRQTAQALDVLAKLEVGPLAEPEAIRWQKATGAERSLAWARTVLARPRPPSEGAMSPPLGALDRAALTRVFADPFGPTTVDLQRTWARRAAQAMDSPALRNAAVAVLAHGDREAARLIKTCIEAAVAADECGKRLELLDALDADDEEDWGGAVNPAEVLSRLSDLPASRLQSIAGGDPKSLAELGPALVRLRSDRYDGTPGLVRLELAVAVARQDWALVRSTFARGGALLPIEVRTSIRLLLAATGGRSNASPGNAGGKPKPLRLPAMPRLVQAPLPSKRDTATSTRGDEDDDRSEDEEGKADGALDGGVSKLVTALWMRSAHPKRALDALRPVWQRLDGPEGAELAGWVWMVAREAREPALERRALARLLRIAPLGEATARVSAERALDRGDGAEARLWAKRAWQSDADGGTAASLFARAFFVGARPGDLSVESVTWIGRLGAVFPFSVWGRLSKAVDERLARTAAELAAVVAAQNDPEKSLDLSPDLAEEFKTNNWIGGRLASLSPEAVVPFAARVTAYLSRRRDKTSIPALAFWAPFVAGDRAATAEAARLAAARSEDGRRRIDRPYVPRLTALDAAKLLAGLRAPLPVPLRQQVYGCFERRDASKTDLPALLDSAAETAKDKADVASLRQLACLSAERLQRVRQSLSLCGRAWGSVAMRTPAVAAALGKVLASNPDAARAEKIDATAFFREAGPAVTGDRSANLLHERAVWLSTLGRQPEAASLEADAWASGYALDGSVAPNAIEWAPYQPLLVRVLLAVSRGDGTQRAFVIGVAAMAAGDVELSGPYLRRAAAEYEGQKASAEQQQWASSLVDTAEVAAADLAKNRIDRGAVSEAFMASAHQTTAGALPGLTRRYPRSLYLALVASDEGLGRLQAPSAAVVGELQREFPRNALVLHTAIRALIVQKRHPEAAALMQKALAAHPGNKQLEALAVMIGSAAAPKASLPPWAASAAAFAQVLEKAEPSGALVEKARLENHEEGAFDVYVPAASAKIATSAFTISHQGVTFTIARVPRVTFCSGPACLEDIVPTLAQQGVEEQWSRAVKLSLGDGQEGLFRGPAGLVLVDAVPVGPYVFYVSAGGRADKLAAALPEVRLVRETLRYRDAALGPARTALLRRQVYFPWNAEGVDPRVRLKLAAASGDACPIAAELRELEPSSRANSVTSLYLATGRAEDRRRLLGCLAGSRDASAALALATIWDTDPDANAFGRAALPRVATGVVRAVGAGVDLTGEETSYQPDEVGDELLTGVIQVMTVLPAEHRRNLGAQLMASGDPRLRALALASLHWVPGVVSPDEVEATLRSGSDGEAGIVTAALPNPVDGRARAAMRARLAAIPAKPTARQLRLATLLALTLAPLLEASDTAALARIRPVLAAAADTGVHPAKHAVTAIDAHALALTGSPGSTEARTLLASWRAKPPEKSTAARASLERPLSERLPDHGWSYFRVGQPGAFLAGLADLANPTGTPDRGRTSTARSLLRRIVSAFGPEELRRSGIDLDRPFECALSTSDARAWACTAALADPAAARRHPVARAGHRSGVTLPWLAGATALALPTSNLFLPLLLPHEPAPPVPATSDESAPETGWLAKEQVTDTTRAAGVELRRSAAMYVGRDHSIDAEEVLSFVGRERVWLFSDAESSRVWLTLPARPKGASPAGRITGAGRGAAALVAWAPAGEDDDTPDGLILDADGSSAGLRIRVRTPIAPAPADVRGLAELLPPGAVLSFVAANVAGAPIWRFRPLGLLSSSDSTPPLWLWQATAAVAFGWYGADPTAKTEEGWVSILPWSPEVEKAWRAHDLPAPGISPASAGSIWFVRRGPALVVGSRPALLALRAAPLAEASAVREPAVPVSARAEGGKLADLLDRRAAGARAGSTTAAGLSTIAAIAGLISSAETRASVRDGVLTSETWIRPTFAARGRGGASIDELLRNQRLKNSLRLPRPLSEEAAGRGVTLTFTGTTAEGMRRAFPDSDRLTLAQVGPDRFKVAVLPQPKDRKPAPLSDLDRRLYISPGGTAPPGAVRAVAADIVGKATSTWDRMRLVVDWVKREMKYEITPSQLDDVTLLERRRGDCTEYAQLTVALLRGLGIPARMRTGLVGEGSLLVAHAWVEFHDGEAWHEIDPTAGRSSVDASYVDVSVMDLLPLIVDGGIRVIDLD